MKQRMRLISGGDRKELGQDSAGKTRRNLKEAKYEKERDPVEFFQRLRDQMNENRKANGKGPLSDSEFKKLAKIYEEL